MALTGRVTTHGAVYMGNQEGRNIFLQKADEMPPTYSESATGAMLLQARKPRIRNGRDRWTCSASTYPI